MSRFRDVARVAADGLRARLLQTSLVAVGPMLGVAAVVGAVGLSQSASGELRQALADLGADVVVIDAPRSPQSPGEMRLPQEAKRRVQGLWIVEGVTALSELADRPIHPTRLGAPGSSSAQYRLWAADTNLPGVVNVSTVTGRFLHTHDIETGAKVAVVGADVAEQFSIQDVSDRSVLIDNQLFGIVGVLESSPILPAVDDAVLIPTTTAATLFDRDTTRPSRLVVRVTSGTTADVAPILSTAVTYGASQPPTIRVPSDLARARTVVDHTLTTVILGMGGLALLIGAAGIANVQLISVMERAREIGVRRALGHPRRVIAGQFLLESALIGTFGGAFGAVAGGIFVAAASVHQGWQPVISIRFGLLVTLGAIGISILAGLHPAVRASRVDPLSLLRAT